MGAWERVSPCDLPQWNERLLNTASHLHQYPFWNESLKLRPDSTEVSGLSERWSGAGVRRHTELRSAACSIWVDLFGTGHSRP